MKDVREAEIDLSLTAAEVDALGMNLLAACDIA
jgi:hypothetical protein